MITFSYPKYFVHSYTVDVVFTLSYLNSDLYYMIGLMVKPLKVFEQKILIFLVKFVNITLS